MTAAEFIDELDLLQSPAELKNVKRFFSDEGMPTKFYGIRMADLFGLAKQFKAMPPAEIRQLLASDYYEARMGAVSIMEFQARDKKTTPDIKRALFELYIAEHKQINNWDMVDRSAPYVVGGYLYDKPRKLLYKLAKSKNVWERRTAIVATYYFIRQNDVEDTFKIAVLLLHDKHHMINKAVGSWLRDAGKRDKQRLLDFLDKYAASIPKVTLRYATERPGNDRSKFEG